MFRLVPRHFYDLHPTAELATGDIWNGLPTFGLVKSEACAGIVVTPSCDLAQCKSRTVTYLPIVQVKHWYQHDEFLASVGVELRALLKQLPTPDCEYEGLLTMPVPLVEECRAVVEKMQERIAEWGEKKQTVVARRVELAASYFLQVSGSDYVGINVENLRTIFGEKNWNRVSGGVIRNSHSTDLHFLPADEHDITVSAVPEHAVVLLRYPLTVPVGVLDLANRVDIHDWSAAIDQLSLPDSMRQIFVHRRPLKTSRLKVEFLSELLTRYTSLFNRLGSPDFEADVVSELQDEIG